jgi:hypothetical protein
MSSISSHIPKISELYKEFETLGDWVNEETIGDHPHLGGKAVSPSYILGQIAQKSEQAGEPKLPYEFVNLVKKLKEWGYGKDAILTFLIMSDIEFNYGKHGVQHVKDIITISNISKDVQEFKMRYGALNKGYTLMMQSMKADLEDLKRKM